MTKLERAGLLLVLLSAYPLSLMSREWVAQRKAYGLYELKRILTEVPGFSDDALTAHIGSHHVELRDDFFGQAAKREDRAKGKVNVIIDGRDYSFTSEVEIRPFYKDQNRYHSWIKLIRLLDRRAQTEHLAIVQRISSAAAFGKEPWEIPKRQLRYRLLLVGSDGKVSEDVFGYEDRARPGYRAMLARYVTPFSIGFHPDVLQAWPTFLYPILYPGLTAIAGIGTLALGFVRRFRRSRDVYSQ